MSKNGTQLYRMVMTELEDRRLERGWPAWMLDDKAGVQDGYSQKMVHVDTPSGRQAGWQTVDLLMQALFPNGYRIKIIPENRGCFDASRQEAALAAYAAFYKGDRVLKDHMKSLRKRARNVGLKAVGKRRRKQIARAAAIARWRKPKITEIAG